MYKDFYYYDVKTHPKKDGWYFCINEYDQQVVLWWGGTYPQGWNLITEWDSMVDADQSAVKKYWDKPIEPPEDDNEKN